MSPADIVDKARRCGVSLALNDAGTGLSLSGVGTPQQNLIALVRDARDVLVAQLQQKRAIRAWINNSFTSGMPSVCMHCGRRWLADEPVIMVRNRLRRGPRSLLGGMGGRAGPSGSPGAAVRMTGAEIIALAKKRGVAVEVIFGKLRVHGEGERDESLVRLLRDNRRAIIDAFLEAETEPDRWRRLVAEKIETIMKVRSLTRRDAESEAFRHIVIEYLNETHPKTDPGVCAHCRGSDLPLTPILPFGIADRHAWLHQRCRDRWADRRRAEAVATLAGMGIAEPPPR